MSFACPSFRSTPFTISQQSFAPGVSHIFGAFSVLKMRHAFMLLPSKSDFHGPAFPAAGWRNRAVRSNTIVGFMGKIYHDAARPLEQKSLRACTHVTTLAKRAIEQPSHDLSTGQRHRGEIPRSVGRRWCRPAGCSLLRSRARAQHGQFAIVRATNPPERDWISEPALVIIAVMTSLD